MQIIIDANASSWSMPAHHQQDWVTTMTKRWRNLVSCWEGAKRKSSQWADFGGEQTDALGLPSDTERDDKDEPEDEEDEEREYDGSLESEAGQAVQRHNVT